MTNTRENALWGVLLVLLLVLLAIWISRGANEVVPATAPGGQPVLPELSDPAVLYRKRADLRYAVMKLTEEQYRAATVERSELLEAQEAAALAELQALRVEADLSAEPGAADLVVALEFARRQLAETELQYQDGSVSVNEVHLRKIAVLDREIALLQQPREVLEDDRFREAAQAWAGEGTAENLKMLAAAEFAVGGE